jgi:hypothetical protein
MTGKEGENIKEDITSAMAISPNKIQGHEALINFFFICECYPEAQK